MAVHDGPEYAIKSITDLKRILAELIIIILMVKFLEEALGAPGARRAHPAAGRSRAGSQTGSLDNDDRPSDSRGYASTFVLIDRYAGLSLFTKTRWNFFPPVAVDRQFISVLI